MLYSYTEEEMTQEEKNLYKTRARKSMLTYEDKLMDGKCLTTSEALFWRNHLILMLVWGNAPRAGEIVNATVADFHSRTEKNGVIAIRVSYKNLCNTVYSMQLLTS